MEGGKLERYKAAIEKHDDGYVQENLLNLDLSLEDLAGKKTLDIGAGGAEFARWANRNGADVISLDDEMFASDKRRLSAIPAPFVLGDARALPFADDSFDLVVSHASMPNVIGSSMREKEEERLEEIVDSMVTALSEAVRVVRHDGEIRLAPVVGPELNSSRQTIQARAVRKSLDILKETPGIEMHETRIKKDEYEEPAEDTDPRREWYRIVIRKPASKVEVQP